MQARFWFFGMIASLLLAGPLSAQKAPPGFKVELLYQPPEIEHPSVVTCDDAGNLFVGEDPMDMRGPTTKEFDRIWRIEFDKEGKPIRKTVFCENLSAVFGMVWLDGSLYVMHAPHYTMFRDTNGDGVADIRKDLADGFGPPAGILGFNDHIVTGTRLGMDGLIYVSVGDKGIQKAIGADGSTISLEGGGVVRMRPDGTKLEVFSSGTRNHLDVPMDHLDNIFTYDNTDDGLGWWTRFTHHVETGYYGYPYDYLQHADRHLPRMSEHGGGSPVGAEGYRDAIWPERYRDIPFFCEWGKGKVQCFHLKRKGATFEAEIEDFLVNDGKGEFRPLDLCFSPDGRHMYLADWNFAGWVNPKVAGRLFRITYVGSDAGRDAKRVAPTSTTAELLNNLGHSSYHERSLVQRRLAAKGAEVAPTLEKEATSAANPLARIHSLWALSGAAEKSPTVDPAPTLRDRLVNDAVGDVRAQAARALALRKEASASAELTKALNDPDPSVRMHAAIALGRIGRAEAVEPLLMSLGDTDTFARFAKVQAIRRIGYWSAVGRLMPKLADDARTGALLALTGQYDPEAVRVLADWALKAPSANERAKVVGLLAEVYQKADPYTTGWWGTQPARNKFTRPKNRDWAGTGLIARSLSSGLDNGDPEVRLTATRALLEAKASDLMDKVRRLASEDADIRVRRAAIAVLADRKDAQASSALIAIARSTQQDDAIREEAIRALAAIKANSASPTLATLASAPSTKIALAAIDALSAIKDPNSAKTLENRLDDSRPEVRARAVAALATVQGKPAAARITRVLADAAVPVRQAAIDALAETKATDAVPALVAIAGDPAVRFEAIRALAQMPDKRALAPLLDGLVHPNNELRDLCRKSLVALRDQIGDDVASLHQRNELPANIRGELVAVFSTPSPILDWWLVGGWDFDNRPKLTTNVKPDLQEVFQIGDRKVPWKAVRSTHPDGMINLHDHVEPKENLWTVAYHTITVDSDQTQSAAVGSDDQILVFLNGKKVHEFMGNRGWSSNQDRFTLELKKGINHLWLWIGNHGDGYAFNMSASKNNPKYGFLATNAPAKLEPAAFADFASKNAGNAKRGGDLFRDPKGIGCVKCHAVAGQGGTIGPDMIGVGAKYPKAELIRSVLEPSNRILSGYELTVIALQSGEVVQGVVKKETPDAIELGLADGKARTVPTSEIESKKRSNVSLMPNGLKDGMTLQDFADIVAYLESLKEPAKKP